MDVDTDQLRHEMRRVKGILIVHDRALENTHANNFAGSKLRYLYSIMMVISL
jgi:hypothetical protein